MGKESILQKQNFLQSDHKVRYKLSLLTNKSNFKSCSTIW